MMRNRVITFPFFLSFPNNLSTYIDEKYFDRDKSLAEKMSVQWSWKVASKRDELDGQVSTPLHPPSIQGMNPTWFGRRVCLGLDLGLLIVPIENASSHGKDLLPVRMNCVRIGGGRENRKWSHTTSWHGNNTRINSGRETGSIPPGLCSVH